MIDTIISLLMGALAGWIAGNIMNSEGGFFRNMVLGVVGGAVGVVVFRFFGFYAHGTIANIIVSVIGACLCIWFGRKFL